MRIYITSRKRTLGSASPSDFHFALERPVELPEGSRGFIDSFVCSNTWETIITGVNDKLYVKWSAGVPRTLTLDPGPIASAADLATKLTTGLAAVDPTMKTVTVTASGDNRVQFSCPTLTGTETFTVYGRTSLLAGTAPHTAAADYQDACEVVGAMTTDLTCSQGTDATSQFISLAPYRQLFLHSHIGTPESYGPNGETTVIGSIIVGNTVVGDVINHHHQGLMASAIDLPPFLGDMHFSLRDYAGRIIDTSGHDVSFTLVIDRNI